jgi:hypothetical protein
MQLVRLLPRVSIKSQATWQVLTLRFQVLKTTASFLSVDTKHQERIDLYSKMQLVRLLPRVSIKSKASWQVFTSQFQVLKLLVLYCMSI